MESNVGCLHSSPYVNQSQYNVCWPMHTSCLFTNTNKKWCPQTQ